MKKRLAIFILFIALLALYGCGTAPTDTNTESSSSTTSVEYEEAPLSWDYTRLMARGKLTNPIPIESDNTNSEVKITKGMLCLPSGNITAIIGGTCGTPSASIHADKEAVIKLMNALEKTQLYSYEEDGIIYGKHDDQGVILRLLIENNDGDYFELIIDNLEKTFIRLEAYKLGIEYKLFESMDTDLIDDTEHSITEGKYLVSSEVSQLLRKIAQCETLDAIDYNNIESIELSDYRYENRKPVLLSKTETKTLANSMKQMDFYEGEFCSGPYHMTALVTMKNKKQYNAIIGTDDCGIIGIENKLFRIKDQNAIRKMQSVVRKYELDPPKLNERELLVSPGYKLAGFKKICHLSFSDFMEYQYINGDDEIITVKERDYEVVIPPLVYNEAVKKEDLVKIGTKDGVWRQTEDELQLWWQDESCEYSISAAPGILDKEEYIKIAKSIEEKKALQ